jgi:hypothetical protein
MGVIITTNHKTDGIYLPADDRRHFVAWSTLVKEAFAPDYWLKFCTGTSMRTASSTSSLCLTLTT